MGVSQPPDPSTFGWERSSDLDPNFVVQTCLSLSGGGFWPTPSSLSDLTSPNNRWDVHLTSLAGKKSSSLSRRYFWWPLIAREGNRR